MSGRFILNGRAYGVRPGQYVRVVQGHKSPDGPGIRHKDLATPGEERFEDFAVCPECFEGSGVYKVRPDGTLLLLLQKFDSSD